MAELVFSVLYMAQSNTRNQRSQIRGALFETIVKRLLKKAGFSAMKPRRNVIRRKFRNVRGRACWHNIDAFGKFNYTIPYVYPIRLLAEAKCYRRNVGLSVVESFVGVVKDISENYFMKDRMSSDDILAYQRYADCGSIFSASDFSPDAQKFALAHGIKLVSYQNNPIIREVVNSLGNLMPSINLTIAVSNLTDFIRYISYKLDNPPHRIYPSRFILPQHNLDFYRNIQELSESLSNIKTSAIGISVGKDGEFQYPIHILSRQEFPERIFYESDTSLFIPHFVGTSENGVVFELEPVNTDVRFYFSLPKTVYQDYYDRGEMLGFKELYLNSIELPITIRDIRRIVRFQLDEHWLNDQRSMLGQ